MPQKYTKKNGKTIGLTLFIFRVSIILIRLIKYCKIEYKDI